MSEPTELDSCGCCEPAPAPEVIYNRPGLPALAYRAGTYGSFLRRMLNRLGIYTLPEGDFAGTQPLSALATRQLDDASIALADATAVVADVLTFYQERIANEGYLRSSLERRSILELARAIGYELSPGVSASTTLAFILEDAPGAPAQALIPQGSKVQSIPPQGKLPQVFETSHEITARKAWNALQPRTFKPQKILTTSQQVILSGTATRLQPGDRVLLVDASNSPQMVRVYQVNADATNKRTTVTFTASPSAATSVSTSTVPGVVDPESQITFSGGAVETWIIGKTWSDKDLRAFLTVNAWDETKLTDYLANRRSGNSDSLGSFHALRASAGFFGNNAPLYGSLPKNNANVTLYPGQDWDLAGGWQIWMNQQSNQYYGSAHVFLERSFPNLVKEGWVCVEAPNQPNLYYKISSLIERSLAAFALSGKTTGLILKKPNGNSLGNNSTDKPTAYSIRAAMAYLQSEELALAGIPQTADLAAGEEHLELDGLVLGLRLGQVVILTGQRTDAGGVTGTEALTIKGITHSAGFTQLTFDSGLAYPYKRETVTINANTVQATHGESASQILGSGSGAQKNQRFTLFKPPLTYVSASTPRGSASTLELRVNNILWSEAASLYPLGGNDQQYILRQTDEGKTEILFGDGEKGARLPTGQNNINARYRSGLGLDGNLEAGALSMLMTRPPGVKGVSNPLPASGGADAEKMDKARANAPLTVRTLERIVTLSDYEDFARAFAGIGKAQAVDLWTGDRHLIYVTVAGADGQALDPQGQTYKNLQQAMRQAHDPAQSFTVGGFKRVLFNLSANIIVDQRYLTEEVFKAIETSLAETYSFEQRGFGLPVTAAGVIACIQSIEGVVAVDLDSLYQNGSPAVLNQILSCGVAHFENNQIKPARLLLINTLGVTLTEVKT